MTTPAKTTTYTQCEQCGFWHAPDEPHCTNCGVSFAQEYKTVYDEKLVKKYEEGWIGAGLGIGLVVGLGIAVAILNYVVGFVGRFFGFFVLLGVSFGVSVGGGIVGSIVGESIGRKKSARQLPQLPKIVANGLSQNEKLINQRLDEIGQKEQKIYGMVEELKQQGDPQRNRVRFQTLDKGVAELSRQRDRYTEKLREIELIRWSNQLSPILSYSPQLNEQQTMERLELLGNIQTQGQKLAQTWKQTPLADEETRCADRLNQALTTCDQLRQDLLDLKTALAVGDISAFNKEEQRASQTALELLDTFNALPDVGGFTAGFKKLEDEYFRLQSEDDVRQLTK